MIISQTIMQTFINVLRNIYVYPVIRTMFSLKYFDTSPADPKTCEQSTCHGILQL